MASKNSSSLAFFFALNILFFTFTCGTDCGCSPRTPKPKPIPSPKPKHVPSPYFPSPSVPSPSVPSPLTPSPSVPTPSIPTPSIPSPSVPSPNTPGSSRNCHIDVLRLGACGNVLSGLLNLQLGQPSSQQCCSLIQGLVDLDAAICLCTALKANVLGINLNVPISVSVLLNQCNKNVPSGFQCA